VGLLGLRCGEEIHYVCCNRTLVDFLNFSFYFSPATRVPD